VVAETDFGEGVRPLTADALTPAEAEHHVGGDTAPWQKTWFVEHDRAHVGDEDRALVAGVESGHRPQQGALAGAAAAKEGDELVAPDLEVDPVEHDPAVEATPHVAGHDRGRVGHLDGHVPLNPRRQLNIVRSRSRTIPSVSSPSAP
jgi:hypothetical protein